MAVASIASMVTRSKLLQICLILTLSGGGRILCAKPLESLSINDLSLSDSDSLKPTPVKKLIEKKPAELAVKNGADADAMRIIQGAKRQKPWTKYRITCGSGQTGSHACSSKELQ